MTTTKWLAAICLVAIVGVRNAQAQAIRWEDHGYAMVNIGLQAASREFTEVQAPLIYGERGNFTVPHKVAAGPFFDLAAGWRVWQNVAVGVGYSLFSDSETPTLTAQIPHPLFGGVRRTATADAGDLSHTESAIHIQLYWNLPQSETFELAIVAGPSFYTIKQDFIAAITPVEGATVSISSPVPQTTLKEKAVGFTAGVDGTFLFTRRYGAGVFGRFSRASTEFELDAGPVEVKAGGFQLGGGLRVRF